MKTKLKNNKGFTIIEVLIVLAIAGLILAIVFLAVPQLQRNARDNQRQNLVTRLKAEMDTYSSNNQGLYPFNTAACGGSGNTGKWCDFYNRYVNGKVNITDPSSGADVITAAPATSCNGTASCVTAFSSNPTIPSKSGVVDIVYGAKCQGESLVASGTASLTSQTYAVMIGLDRTNTVYCVDNG